jgi:hypothetical protein
MASGGHNLPSLLEIQDVLDRENVYPYPQNVGHLNAVYNFVKHLGETTLDWSKSPPRVLAAARYAIDCSGRNLYDRQHHLLPHLPASVWENIVLYFPCYIQ